MQTFFKKNSSSRAFTIIELLVATAVTAVLAGMLLMMTNSVLNAWNRTSGALGANSQAQFVFDMLVEDLQSAIFRHDGNTWLLAEIIDNSTTNNPPPALANDRGWTTSGKVKPGAGSNERREQSLARNRFGRAGAGLQFFTTGGGTEPVAVSYQLIRRHVTGDPDDNNNPAEIRYMLYRSTVGSGTTLRSGYDLRPDRNTYYTGPNTEYPNQSPLLRPGGNGGVIADNVVDFGIRLYGNVGGQMSLLFPSTNTNFAPDENNLVYLADGYFEKENVVITGMPGATRGPFPEAVDIFVRVLTSEGARQIQNLEAGRIPDQGRFNELWWEIAEANSQLFTQRIYINARPF
jgi:type II secretory pathway pseudopilin PulG